MRDPIAGRPGPRRVQVAVLDELSGRQPQPIESRNMYSVSQ